MRTITHGPKTASWLISDAVIRLRHWGRRDGYDLPSEIETLIVGSVEGCGLRLQDAIASVSRQHAVLSREGETWTIRDTESKNGTRLDGERRLSFALTPGVEIELGDVKLIAESARLLELHRFLSRIIGFGDLRLPEVDAALRGVRDCASRRTTLAVCGAGSLPAIARRLHDLALGTERPFVSTEDSIVTAIESAAGGTLCLDAGALPDELPITPETSLSCALVVCARNRAKAVEAMKRMRRPMTIVELPPLDARHDDRDKLIMAYADDAARALGVTGNGFREHDLYWLRDVTFANLDDIEEVMLRVVAARTWGVTHGGEKIGLTHGALGTYLRRRGIPT